MQQQDTAQIKDGLEAENISHPLTWRELFDQPYTVVMSNHDTHFNLSMPNETILQKINQAALHFLEPISLQKTYETITLEAIKLVKGADGFILLAEGKSDELHYVYGSSNYAVPQPRRHGHTYRAFKEKIAFVVNFSQQPSSHPEIQRSNFRSVIFIPLFYQNKSFGTLIIRSTKEEEFEDNDLEVLKVFGSMATLAIRKAQLYQQNQRALKIRDLFMSMASHELKTPLTAIHGYVQLLHSKLKKDPESSEFKWSENLLSETRRLTDLVNELLQTNTIKSGKLQFTWKECHLIDTIEKVITSYSFSAPRRQITFRNEIPTGQDVVIGDADKLFQVFDNVLDNAIKFSSSDKPIVIEACLEEPFLTVEIIDEGKGIPRKDLPHVFEEFYKSESDTMHMNPGMGLGLFLVKTILTQHHGKIQISSSKKGTKVTIKLRRVEL